MIILPFNVLNKHPAMAPSISTYISERNLSCHYGKTMPSVLITY
jgi:hypothetical protein